ncbi:MAG: metal-dependent hydrolase [Polyangiaceae bacterium]
MKIVKRRIDFDFDPDAVPRAWYRGDLHLTTFWSSLSLLFPEGERFFVEAVRRFRDRITDPELLAQIDAFVAQEAMHGKQHRAFNDMVRARGMAVAEPAEQQLRRLLGFARRTLSPRGQLAVTCALEHFTAIMAEQLLAQEDHRDSGHESVRHLWVWHALEEAEHKAVAFDVYRAVGGTYGMRVGLMLVTSAIFFAEQLNVHARFLRAEGELWNAAGWARALGYFWVRPGLFRRLVPAYLDYFRPGFHPEDRDTGALIAHWREALFGEAGELREKLKAA